MNFKNRLAETTWILSLALSFANALSAQSNVFPSTGNAGVGTTTPTSILDIAYNPDPVLRIRNSASGVGAYFSPNSLGDFVITGQGGSNLLLSAGNSMLFLKYSDSTIGLGTKTPGARAEVFGITGSYFPVLRLNTNYSGAVPVDLNPFITGVSTSGFELRLSGATRFAVNSSGNVGIGTPNPTHKLSVNGTVRAKEVIVETTGWPDYVFTKEHRRTSLEETEAFIDQNGHLPGIPSAAEVAENGVSVGELQVKLLQKLEEMTLHQIEMQKKLEALQRENKRLEEDTSRIWKELNAYKNR